MIDFKLDKKVNYVVACTFGPDSMALVNMLVEEGIKPIVASVNYKKFRHSASDSARLAEYCAEKSLILETLDAENLPAEEQMKEGENFNDWARKARYNHFKRIYEKYHAAALFLAHQQDDLLEAYLLQKERKVSDIRFGYSEVTTYDGMMVVRPLLKYSRQDLLDYNEEKRVPYSLEEDAYENEFTRSSIRKDIIANLSEIDRGMLLDEMKEANDEKNRLAEEFKETILEGEELEIRPLMAMSKDVFATTLIRFVQKQADDVHLTPAMLEKIRAFLINEKVNDTFKLSDELFLVKEYDLLTVGKNFDELPYSYTLAKPGELHTEQFDLDFSMGAEDRGIHESDYPLTIRTAIPSDSYVAEHYLESVRTLYSDWKMPVRLRYVWPVFVNKDGKIIYVPRYRQGFSEYHTSVLKMHLKEGEN